MEINSSRPLYILVCNHFGRAIGSLKNMKIARTAELPCIIHAIDTDNFEPFRIRQGKYYIKFDTVMQQALQQADASAVHYETAEFRKNHISCHTSPKDASSQDVLECEKN